MKLTFESRQWDYGGGLVVVDLTCYDKDQSVYTLRSTLPKEIHTDWHKYEIDNMFSKLKEAVLEKMQTNGWDK